jgi:Holliday junction DNA helicase RuvB
MIAVLRGHLLEKHPSRLIVDVHGVGYDVQVPVSTFYQAGETGHAVTLRIHTHVREDQIALFGFATALEHDLFERLIAVNGIGPKLALSVLSGIESADFIRAVEQGDVTRLTRIPASAARRRAHDAGAARSAAEGRRRRSGCAAVAEGPRGDVVSALVNLGYPAGRRREGDRRRRQGRARRRDLRRPPPPRAAAAVAMTGPNPRPPRLVGGVAADDDRQYDAGLRPRTMDEYIGQDRIRENLLVSIQAARQRGEALDHVLLYGPPGLGKTTLAHVIGNELGVPVRSTAGPVLEKPGDLAAILTSLKAREVLFIDEIHGMSPAIEEILYPALEDYELDLVIGQGPARARQGAAAAVHAGRRDRPHRASSPRRCAAASASSIASTSTPSRTWPRSCAGRRGSRGPVRRRGRHRAVAPGPRHAAHRQPAAAAGPDYAQVRADGTITMPVAQTALAMLEVDEHGFDEIDRRLLRTIIDKFGGGPVG